MLEIKTIINNLDEVEQFNKRVNEALTDGWELVRRDVLPGWEGETTVAYRKLYAELEREKDLTIDIQVQTSELSQWCAEANIIEPRDVAMRRQSLKGVMT